MMYEWNENKSQSNLRKNGIDFSVAIEVFSDSNAIIQFNRETGAWGVMIYRAALFLLLFSFQFGYFRFRPISGSFMD